MAKSTNTKAKVGKSTPSRVKPSNSKKAKNARKPQRTATPEAEKTVETSNAEVPLETSAGVTAMTKPPTPEVELTTATPDALPAVPLGSRLPAVGTVLQKRDRHGNVRCECEIVDGGVRYAGTIHRSLSAAAVAAAKDLGLAAKAMNGFTFWGVIKPTRQGTDPVATLEKAWSRYWANLETTLEKSKDGEHRAPLLTTIQRHARVLQNLHDEVA